MRRALKPALVTAALSVAAVAAYLTYRLAQRPAPSPVAAGTPPAAATSSKSLVAELPDFTLQNLAGQQQSIKSLAGRPMLINFWATWCGPCRREIPMLKGVQSDNPWVTVVGIAIDDADAVQKYAASMKFNYPILMGESAATNAAASFGVDFFALPFTVFADSQGRLLGVHTGELHPEQVANVLAVFKDLADRRIDLKAARDRIAARM